MANGSIGKDLRGQLASEYLLGLSHEALDFGSIGRGTNSSAKLHRQALIDSHRLASILSAQTIQLSARRIGYRKSAVEQWLVARTIKRVGGLVEQTTTPASSRGAAS